MKSLESIELFKNLSPEDRKNVEDFCQKKEVKAGEILFSLWDVPQALYIIESWSLSVRKIENGNDIEVAILRTGDIVWEMAFFWEEKTRNATVLAKEPSSLFVLLAFSLVQLFQKYPYIQERLQEIMTQRSKKDL